MARDRERAKRRRAERRAGGGDDAVDSPLGEGTGAPDPLRGRHARRRRGPHGRGRARPRPATTTSGPTIFPDELEDDRSYRADDAVEGDTVSSATAPAARAAHPPRRKRGRVITFLGHCIDELRRVQWPNRKQVGQATAVVLGFVVIAGGYLGLLDALWQPLIDAIL